MKKNLVGIYAVQVPHTSDKIKNFFLTVSETV